MEFKFLYVTVNIEAKKWLLIFIVSTIVDSQVLTMFLEVILVNFNFKDNSDYYDYNYDDDDVLHFELRGCKYCFHCLQ